MGNDIVRFDRRERVGIRSKLQVVRCKSTEVGTRGSWDEPRAKELKIKIKTVDFPRSPRPCHQDSPVRTDMDELTGLPLAFGKPVQEKKQFGNTAKISQTKRVRPLSTRRARHMIPLTGPSVQNRPDEADKGKRAAAAEADDEPRRDDPDQPSFETGHGDQGSSYEGSDLPTTHEVVLKDHIKVRRHVIDLFPAKLIEDPHSRAAPRRCRPCRWIRLEHVSSRAVTITTSRSGISEV